MTDEAQMLEKFYDSDARSYDASRFSSAFGEEDSRHLMALIGESLSRMDLSNVLEIGSGTGRVTRVVAEAGPKRLTCADLSREMLSIVGDLNLQPKPSLCHASAFDLPFPDSSFSSVVSVNVLSHLRDLRLFFQEAGRVLRPGGRILITSTNARSIFLPFAVYANMRRLAYGQDVPAAWHSLKSLKSTAMKADIDILSVVGEIYLPRALDRGHIGHIVYPGITSFRRLPSLVRSKVAPMIILQGAKA